MEMLLRELLFPLEDDSGDAFESTILNWNFGT